MLNCAQLNLYHVRWVGDMYSFKDCYTFHKNKNFKKSLKYAYVPFYLLWKRIVLLYSMVEDGMSRISSHKERRVTSLHLSEGWLLGCVKSGIWQEECASDFFSGSQNTLTEWE